MTKFKQSVVNIPEICAQKGVRNVIISPGSRSAPLTLAFLRHPGITCRTIVDERSAAFVALGLAQQIEAPVALICTSGTAALNYAPAVAEAFYQQIPLLVLTADRPPEWIGQNDGQTIVQQQLFAPHCRAALELPVDDSHSDARWHSERIVSEAINRTQWPVPGPVHINVPLREPLYPAQELTYETDVKTISLVQPQAFLAVATWQALLSEWTETRKKLIVAGLARPNESLNKTLATLQKGGDCVLIADVVSNCHNCHPVQHADMILGTSAESLQCDLMPDLLVTFGGAVVSKNLKLLLRKYKPRRHWQVQLDSACVDTFQSLTHILPVTPEYFFDTLQKRVPDGRAQDHEYFSRWQEMANRAQRTLDAFLGHAPHCELLTMAAVLTQLPPESCLQLGNSSIVRLANLVSLAATKGLSVNSNRGTSGIDGTVSTAVGAALATDSITTLITGDLAFFYDRNALWNRYVPPNLRVVVFNNGGGGIFRILDGSSTLPELAPHFEVEHELRAKNVARDHGLQYRYCDSAEALVGALPEFFAPGNRAALLEVGFDKKVNADAFMKFRSMMREIK